MVFPNGKLPEGNLPEGQFPGFRLFPMVSSATTPGCGMQTSLMLFFDNLPIRFGEICSDVIITFQLAKMILKCGTIA